LIKKYLGLQQNNDVPSTTKIIYCKPKVDILRLIGVSPKPSFTAENIARGTHTFTYNLLHYMQDPYDFVFSPHGILNSAMVVLAGAQGYTATELRNAFDLYLKSPHDKVYLIDAVLKLNTLLDTLPNITIKNNTTMLIDKCQTIRQIFADIAPALGDVCFTSFNDLGHINGKIEEDTKGQIKNALTDEELVSEKLNTYRGGLTSTLLNRTDIDPTKMVIFNSLTFSGKWKHPFSMYDTRREVFRCNNCARNEEMMHQQNIFSFYRDDKVDVLKMDYSNDNISMLVMLPWNPIHETETMPFQLIKNDISSTKWSDYFIPDYTEIDYYYKNFNERRVDVKLPKFTKEFNLNLKAVFDHFGIRTLNQDPILTDLSPNNDMSVSKMIQKTKIEINETGTNVSNMNYPPRENMYCDKDVVNFHANREFLYYIVHNLTKQVLYVGLYL
jgi:serine protease inhibitor